MSRHNKIIADENTRIIDFPIYYPPFRKLELHRAGGRPTIAFDLQGTLVGFDRNRKESLVRPGIINVLNTLAASNVRLVVWSKASTLDVNNYIRKFPQLFHKVEVIIPMEAYYLPSLLTQLVDQNDVSSDKIDATMMEAWSDLLKSGDPVISAAINQNIQADFWRRLLEISKDSLATVSPYFASTNPWAFMNGMALRAYLHHCHSSYEDMINWSQKLMDVYRESFAHIRESYNDEASRSIVKAIDAVYYNLLFMKLEKMVEESSDHILHQWLQDLYDKDIISGVSIENFFRSTPKYIRVLGYDLLVDDSGPGSAFGKTRPPYPVYQIAEYTSGEDAEDVNRLAERLLRHLPKRS